MSDTTESSTQLAVRIRRNAKYLALMYVGMTTIAVYIVTGALSASASVVVLLR
jgi:hypothetical protein